MKRITALILTCTMAAAGCQRNPEEDRMSAPPPPPAVRIAPIRDSMTLEERLAVLEAELDAALDDDRLDAVTKQRLFRAEAITDRILETELTLTWLAEGYDLEARLRQLQALADRIVAGIRRDEPEAGILLDAVRLRRQVQSLRSALAEGGMNPPPPLDSLLYRASFGEEEDEDATP